MGHWRNVVKSLRAETALRWALLLAVVAVLAVGNRAEAQIFYSWIDPNGGSYHSNSNWSPFGVPDTLDEGAGFDLNSIYTVDFSADVTTSEAAVSAGLVTFDLDAGGTERTYNIAYLSAIGSGHLIIDDGTVRAGQLFVQNTGKITIAFSGTATPWGKLNVTGNININGGSLVDERNFFPNFLGPSLIVQNGGSYAGNLTLLAGSMARITGQGSSWTSRKLEARGETPFRACSPFSRGESDREI